MHYAFKSLFPCDTIKLLSEIACIIVKQYNFMQIIEFLQYKKLLRNEKYTKLQANYILQSM